MRKSSKIFWIALVVVAMLVVTTLGAMASGTTDAEIYGELVVGDAGAFSVDYKIKNVDTKVECGKITLNWDSESTEVVDVEYASILGTAEYKAGTGEAVIAWAGSEITEATADGTLLFTVNFATEDEGVIPVTTTVDNFGTVGSFAIAYDCAKDVTANAVYAADNEVTNPTTLTVGVDGTIAEILEAAMNYAQSVDVVVDLNGETWTITEDGSLGSAESIPANTITIQNGTITQKVISPRLSTDVAYTTVMYGHFVFDNITLGIDYTKTVEFGGFVFPEGCSGTFEDITPGTVAPNLYGNVTVKSGTYCIISGGIYSKKEGFGAVVNNPVIVVEGETIANRVVGGTFKTNVDESVTGTATVTVQGGASVTGELVAGAMFRRGYSVGATLTVNTTGTINAIISSAVAYGIAEEDMETFTTTIKNATVTGGVYGYRFNNTEASYVDVTTNIAGGTFNGDVYGGADAPKAGATLYGTTVLNITGGYFGAYASKTTVYGGSNVTGADFDHNADSTLTISGGRYYNGFFGGSKLHAQNAKHSGTSSVIVTKTPNTYANNQYIGHIFGGSDIQGTSTGRVHSGDSSVTIGTTDSKVTVNLGVYGGSFIQRIGAHEGNSTVTINNADLNNASDGFYTYGGSSLGHVGYSCTGDVLHKGNSSVIINKATISGQNYVFGGSEVNTAGGNTKHIGNSNVTINGGEFGTSSIKLAGIFGGSKLVENSMHKGASTLTINGGTIYANIVLAGSYGSGTIDGASTFTMTAGTITGSANSAEARNPLGAGSYGTNDLDADETSTALGMTGGIRQTGNLTFNMQGGTISTSNTPWVQVTGVKSNLKGDLTVNIKGGTIGAINFVGREATAGVTGDVKVYLTGGIIQNQFRGGEPGCIVGGNLYVEYSGTEVKGDFTPAFHAIVKGKVYVKLIGNPFFRDDKKVYIDSQPANNNTSVLDLVHYTGSRTFTTGNASSANYVDKIIYPVVDISGITLTNTNVAPGQQLAELVPATLPASLTSGNVAYTYAEFTEFDGYTEYDNFVFYAANGENANNPITEVSPDPTQQVKFKVGSLTSEVITLDHVFKIANKSLSLASKIFVNYKSSGNLDTYGYSNPYLVVKFGEDKQITEFTTDDKGRWVFVFDQIAPQGVSEVAEVILYANYGDELIASPVLEYSVAEYCYNTLAKYPADTYPSEYYANLRTLLVDLLNYAAQAQIYITYNTENLANAALTDEQASWGSSTLDPIPESIKNLDYEVIDNPSVAISTAITLQSNVMIRYKLTTEDAENLTIKVTNLDNSGGAYTWTYTSEDLEPVSGKQGQYYLYFSELNADQMGDRITMTVYNGEIAVSNTCLYSIESYAASYYNSTSYPDVAKLVTAMMKYGNSAYNFGN